MASRPRGPFQIALFGAAVAVVFGTLVSAVSVLLAPRHAEHLKRERMGALQSLLDCDPALAALLDEAVEGGGAALEAHVVDLASGCYDPGIDATCFDVDAAADDPGRRLVLEKEDDIASIGERPNRVIVYEVRRDGAVVLLVLPVYGMGYQSRLEGYLSLEADLDTVSSLVFYRHGETPGMGARIVDPDWQAGWRGKRTRDDTGQLRIGVSIRDESAPSPWEIDAMSGATRTGQAVTNLLRFWLGERGYAPLIRNLRSGAACVEAAH